MPQGMDGTSKCSKINERLGKRSTWPRLCSCHRAMRMPLCIAIIRAKEVREFPISLLVAKESGTPSFRPISKDRTHNKTHKKGECHV